MENFHKAKHWHIFLAIFALPFVLYMAFIMIAAASVAQDGDPTTFFSMMKYYMYIVLIPAAIQYGWMYSIGVGLQDYLPSELRMKTGLFKAAIFALVVYMLFLVFYMGNMMSNIMEMSMQNMENMGNGGEMVDPEAMMSSYITSFMMLIPFGIIAMVASFYAMYFTAKVYKTTELQQSTGFGDFVGEFFMIWFMLIGIWFMQPKINKMVTAQPESRIDEFGRDPFE